jgi:hypothetical protein
MAVSRTGKSIDRLLQDFPGSVMGTRARARFCVSSSPPRRVCDCGAANVRAEPQSPVIATINEQSLWFSDSPKSSLVEGAAEAANPRRSSPKRCKRQLQAAESTSVSSFRIAHSEGYKPSGSWTAPFCVHIQVGQSGAIRAHWTAGLRGYFGVRFPRSGPQTNCRSVIGQSGGRLPSCSS